MSLMTGYLIVFVFIQPGAKNALRELFLGNFSVKAPVDQSVKESNISQPWSGAESSSFTECSQSRNVATILTRAERWDMYREMDEDELMDEINMAQRHTLNDRLIGSGANPIVITFADENSSNSIHLAFSSQGDTSDSSKPVNIDL